MSFLFANLYYSGEHFAKKKKKKITTNMMKSNDLFWDQILFIEWFGLGLTLQII